MTIIPFEEPEDASAAAWQRVRAARASDEIVAQFRDVLFQGRLRPGDRVGSEAELAARFGVSRITVRDALRTLEASGIVEIRVGARGGARIAAGDPDRFSDALAVQLKLVGLTALEAIDAQQAIECAAAELTAEHATPEDLARLRALVEAAAALTDDPAAFRERSVAFHAALVAASHNRALVAAHKAIQAALLAVYPPPTADVVVRRILNAHRGIVRALEARDRAGVRELMARHIGIVRVNSTATGGRSRRGRAARSTASTDVCVAGG